VLVERAQTERGKDEAVLGWTAREIELQPERRGREIPGWSD
jgi:hypothetical protein